MWATLAAAEQEELKELVEAELQHLQSARSIRERMMFR